MVEGEVTVKARKVDPEKNNHWLQRFQRWTGEQFYFNDVLDISGIPFYSGQSGSGLINEDGELIGLVALGTYKPDDGNPDTFEGVAIDLREISTQLYSEIDKIKEEYM